MRCARPLTALRNSLPSLPLFNTHPLILFCDCFRPLCLVSGTCLPQPNSTYSFSPVTGAIEFRTIRPVKVTVTIRAGLETSPPFPFSA